MTNKRRFNLWQWIWLQVWNLSEWSGIGLGRFAPWVLHQMIGCNYPVKKIKSGDNNG
ncbi:hypothetical protein L7G72_12695 [Xenorhabdus bovienii]|uniref:hypothetical protein n=1 Tax=Xenorhabdus bovienii TaxID=40576 RepID=UPI001EDCD025|nr:hypothetical protein [Xenorhabdus bovienii]MCG3462698.1 hypothetical protein [Xenorhabdus bovienii]